MAQYIAIRTLNRGSKVRVVNSAGNKVQLSSTADTVINLDLVSNRLALGHHMAIGQYIVTAANAATQPGAVALPANS